MSSNIEEKIKNLDAKSLTLEEVIDKIQTEKLIKSIGDLFNLPIRIVNNSSELIAVYTKSNYLCDQLISISEENKEKCLKCITASKELKLKEKIEYYNCWSGLSYVITPLLYELDQIGRVIFGPVLINEKQETFIDTIKNNKLTNAPKIISEFPPLKKYAIEKIVSSMLTILDIAISLQFKNYITTELHLESITISYNDLEKKNEELKKAYDNLKEVDRIKSNFLAAVSHELKTPLTSIIGYSEMLTEGFVGTLSNEQQQCIKTIQEQGNKLLNIISSVLDYTRMQTGRMSYNFEVVSPLDICMDAINEVQNEADKRGVDIEINVAEDIPFLRVDKDKIVRAIFHIIDNAVKFTSMGGKVIISANVIKVKTEDVDDVPSVINVPEKDMIEIQITDNGIGIPEEFRNSIFDAFYQIDGSTTREHGGLGIGLAIVKSFIENHGGKIYVESSAGKGSTFKIHLPIFKLEQ